MMPWLWTLWMIAVPVDTVSITVPPNAALFDLLKPYAETPEQSYQLSHTLLQALAPRPPMAGDQMWVILDSSGIQQLLYELQPWERLILRRDHDQWRTLKEQKTLQRRLLEIRGAIDGSLYETLQRQGYPPKLSVQFAEIFAWDIDFFVETSAGDSFAMLVEELWWKGKRVDFGRILWARYTGKRTGTLEAVYFNGAYYAPDGTPLRRQFLRSPLTYRRITSFFTKRRFHPILRKYRPHHGIDYAAPYGTPVSSVADGVVLYAGWKGGYGKFVQIRHANGYVTGYGHLSRIARGIRRGVRVKQGQVIGYVGSTGLSTGPHLHFEMKFNGRYVNPLRIRPPRTKPLPAAWRPYLHLQWTTLQQYRQRQTPIPQDGRPTS